MSKRMTDSAIWNDDWFYDLSTDHKLFWFYIKDDCDHAGIWKPKTRPFKSITDIDIDLEYVLQCFNQDKTRIRILDNGYWFIEDFCFFQYCSKEHTLSIANTVHDSVIKVYNKMGVPLESVRGLHFIKVDKNRTLSVSEYVKQEENTRALLGATKGLTRGYQGLKDKDKDKEKDKVGVYAQEFEKEFYN